MEYRLELILNVTVFFVSVCVREYIEELILNIFFCCECLGKSIYREPILNITVLVVRVWEKNI
jgi:hypothetical protein